MKTVFQVIEGNAKGVVEEPDTLDPTIPLDRQRIMTIGAVAHDGWPDTARQDWRVVLDKLTEFCRRP